MVPEDDGRVASPNRLSSDDEARSGLHPSGFDPARWQPIETAPKDGTSVLVFYRGRMFVAEYAAVWHPDNRRWCVREPNTPSTDRGGNTIVCEIDHQFLGDQMLPGSAAPTHWMPLPPKPPAQGTEARRAETGTGSVHDGPVAEGHAPNTSQQGQ